MAFELYKQVRASNVCAGKPSAFQILQELAWLTEKRKGYAWPSEAALAQMTRQSERTVQRAVAYLRKEGLIAVEVLTNGEKRAKNRYRINEAKLKLHDKMTASTRQNDVIPAANLSEPDDNLSKTTRQNGVVNRTSKRMKDISEKEHKEANSARVEKITIAGRPFTRSEWELSAKTHTSFGTGIAQVEFADGRADYAIIGWDDMKLRHVLRSRAGGQVIL